MHPPILTPSPEHVRLTTALAGEWVADERSYPSPWDPRGGTSQARSVNRVALGGLFLINDYVQEQGGRPVFYGHGVYGYDPTSGRYTMQWWDSMATRGGDIVFGTWIGDTLRFASAPGRPPSRYEYEILGPDSYRFTLSLSHDGGETWAPALEGLYRRVRA
ncbi:MAG TPA: DUF1579 family protein [Nannocystis sp.]